MATSRLLLLLLLSLVARADAAPTFGLRLHHRFSDSVRASIPSADLPERGTAEYYAVLAGHSLHRRGLAGAPQELTFADGNNTLRLSGNFGHLHYAFVELGTPMVKFLVALDTGSNLFWVPCDCDRCAPTSNDRYNLSFNIFKSSASSSSRKVGCSSSLCDLQSSCSKPNDTCPYVVKYVDNSSTSGYLLEDVIHLVTDDEQKSPVTARITFGCGQKQPDSFTAIPNGLLGLGLGNVSVPNTLAAAGLTANSFSMCFSDDGSGRITFGDMGDPNQNTTTFRSNLPFYVVTATSIVVGGQPLSVPIMAAIFDTGSSYTILADPFYTELTQTFDSFIQRERLSIGQKDFPFDYCYKIGPTESTIKLPVINFVMKGGNVFRVLNTIVVIPDENRNYIGFCVAIIKHTTLNIIGQNFMTRYKLVFDKQNLVLGWKEFDCKKQEFQTSAPGPGSPPQSYVNHTITPTNSPSGSSNGTRSKTNSVTSLFKLPWLLCTMLSTLPSLLVYIF